MNGKTTKNNEKQTKNYFKMTKNLKYWENKISTKNGCWYSKNILTTNWGSWNAEWATHKENWRVGNSIRKSNHVWCSTHEWKKVRWNRTTSGCTYRW